MIETLEAPDHVVAFRASGRIDEADIERSFATVEAALARHERIALYAEVDVTGITPGALARDLQYSLGKLQELRRFPRVAVVTSQDWVRWAARVEGAILPQIEVRVFPPAEREDALAWVMQPPAPVPAESVPAPRSVQVIETAASDVIAFAVNGRVGVEDMRLLIARSDQAMRAHERVQVLVRIVSFGGVSLEALREEGLVSMKMKGWRQVDRYALVGGPSWMVRIASWPAPFSGIQTRHFEPDQEEEAWRWLGEAARHT